MDLAIGGGLLLTAAALGVTHGIEPDHVAGITSLTHEAGDAKLSALVGGCFGLGHAVLVVVWIAVVALLLGTTTVPAVFEQVGMLVVGVVLSVLGLSLGVSGTRKLVHKHGHDHGDGFHVHYHVHLPTRPRSIAEHEEEAEDVHGDHGHDHGVIAYLKIGVVGALFTLSPPVSMIAFISVLMSQGGGTLIVGVVAVYTTTIVATMTLIGGGAGTLIGVSKARGERFHTISQLVVSGLVLVVGLHLLATAVPSLLA